MARQSRRPLNVEYDTKVKVKASNTGLLVLGGAVALGFGYLLYKYLTPNPVTNALSSGSGGASAGGGSGGTLTSGAQSGVFANASNGAEGNQVVGQTASYDNTNPFGPSIIPSGA